MHPHERQGDVIARVELGGFANESRLAKAGHHAHSNVLESKPSSEERSEDSQTCIGNLSHKLGVLEEIGHLLTNHTDAGNKSLALGLSPLHSFVPHHVHIKLLLLTSKLLVVCHLLVQLLLLDGGFQLILVFQRLLFHHFLTGQTFLVCLSSCLPHLFLLGKLLLIALQLELHLVLGLSLLRFLLELNGLALLFLLHLGLLDLEFLLRLLQFESFSLFLLEGNVEG